MDGSFAQGGRSCKDKEQVHRVNGAQWMLCVAVSFFTISLGRTQGTLDAVTIGSGFQPVGYVNGGVGWTFVPTVDIAVTAIGHSEAGPYETHFWAGTKISDPSGPSN
jgi:hypothetical protein